MSTFAHDDTNQLTEANHDYQADETYKYYDNGNREKVNGTEYDTTAGNRLASDGVFTYTYDDEGNRTTRTRISQDPADDYLTEYQWDHRNRLISVTLKNNSATVTKYVEYTYDAANRRVCTAVDDDGDGTLDDYRYDIYHSGALRMELTDPDGLGTGAPTTIAHRYLWGPAVDQILAVEDPAGEVLWGLSDHQGTIRDIVNSTGTVVDHRQYNSFGEITTETNPAVDFIFGYTGKPLDPDTGLQYNHNRWYDATVGRWLSEDPIPDDINPYRYVGNGPLNHVDPQGLSCVPVCCFFRNSSAMWGETNTTAQGHGHLQ